MLDLLTTIQYCFSRMLRGTRFESQPSSLRRLVHVFPCIYWHNTLKYSLGLFLLSCTSIRFRVVASSYGLRDQTHRTQHARQDSCGRVIIPTQRYVPDNAQQSQQTDVHARGGIRTRNPSKRTATDTRLRQCGHWYRPLQH